MKKILPALSRFAERIRKERKSSEDIFANSLDEEEEKNVKKKTSLIYIWIMIMMNAELCQVCLNTYLLIAQL